MIISDNDAHQPEDTTTGETQTTTLIVFGLDDKDKPHASWFTDADAPLAEKAAGLMRMRILRLSDEARQKLAGKLSQGRVFASGKAFVPFINQTLYGQLDAMGGEIPPYTGDVPEEESKAKKPVKPTFMRATSLTDLAVDQVVLAPEDGKDNGWWEAVVKEQKDDGLFVLYWYSWPKEPTLVRKRDQLALLPPDGVIKL